MDLVGSVTLTFRFTKEENKWVGVCVELGTSTFGSNFERVAADLETLVAEHLDLLEEAGERENFFIENGIEENPAEPDLERLRRSMENTVVANWVDPYFDSKAPYFQPHIVRFPKSRVAG